MPDESEGFPPDPVDSGSEEARWLLASSRHGAATVTAPDPLSVTCPLCDAAPGERCMAVSDWARKPHAARRRLALVLTAHADPALDEFFPHHGPCGLCNTPGLGARHRVIDAVAAMLAEGEDPEAAAVEYEVPLPAVQAVAQWAARWPGAWT